MQVSIDQSEVAAVFKAHSVLDDFSSEMFESLGLAEFHPSNPACQEGKGGALLWGETPRQESSFSSVACSC